MTKPIPDAKAMTPKQSTQDNNPRKPLTRRQKILAAATVLALHAGMFLISTPWSFAIAIAATIAADKYDRKHEAPDCEDLRLLDYILAGMCTVVALVFVVGIVAVCVLVVVS